MPNGDIVKRLFKAKFLSLFPAGFEPATLCVWSTRDNHYTKET